MKLKLDKGMWYGALVDAGRAGEYLGGRGVKDRRSKSVDKEKWEEKEGPRQQYKWVFLYWVWVTWPLGRTVRDWSKLGRGPGLGIGRVLIRDSARDRVRRKTGAAIRVWSKPQKGGRASDGVDASPLQGRNGVQE